MVHAHRHHGHGLLGCLVGCGFVFGFVVGCATHAAFVAGGCGGGGGFWRLGFFVVGHVSANSRLGAIFHAGLYRVCQLVGVCLDAGCAADVVGGVCGSQSFARWLGPGRVDRSQFGFASQVFALAFVGRTGLVHGGSRCSDWLDCFCGLGRASFGSGQSQSGAWQNP